MKRRFLKITYCVLFLVISTACAIAMPFYASDGTRQKRSLAEFPQPIIGNRLNLSFPKAFEDWLKDHIAWRDELVTIRSRALAGIQTSPDKQVIIGSDGWMYFQETLKDYTGESAFTQNDLYRVSAVMRGLNNALAKKGIPLIVAIAPNKSTVYPAYMPPGYPRRNGPGNAQRLQVLQGAQFVDLTSLLTGQARQDRLLYHKTDTHWNHFGARLSAHALLSTLAKVTKTSIDLPDLSDPGTVRRDWTGDLSQMIYPANTPREEQYYYEDMGQEFSVKGRMRSLEDMSIITAGGKTDLNLLVLRDSFSNALIPYLSNAFSNVQYKRQMPLPFMDLVNVDAVVLEMVERRLPELLTGAPVMMAETCGAWDREGGTAKLTAYAHPTNDGVRVFGYAGSSADRIMECSVSVTASGSSTFYDAFPIWETKLASQLGIAGENQDGAFSLLLQNIPVDAQIQVRFVGDNVLLTQPATVKWVP